MSTAHANVPPISIPASADLSAYQFRAMKLGSTGLALPSAGGDVVGILQDAPSAAGMMGSVRILGPSKLMVDGAVTQGDFLKVDATGKGVAATADEVAAGLAKFQALETGTSCRIEVTILPCPVYAAVSGSETVTSGALSLDKSTSYVSVTNTVAFTLADGKYVGQRKRIEVTAVSGMPIGTLTINDAYGTEPTVWTFGAIGQMIDLEWTATGWKLQAIRRAGTKVVTVGTTTMSTTRLFKQLDLSVIDTVTSALPDGLVPGERINVQETVAGGSPVGSLTGTYEGTTGTAGTSLTAWDATTDYAVLEWNGAAWHVDSLSGPSLT